MDMTEIILWTALGFAPTLAAITMWNMAQKKTSPLIDQVVAKVVN